MELPHQQRLAIFLPALHGGGAERTMLNLASGIAGRGYAVDLVLAKATGPFVSQVPKSVRLVDLDARRTLTSLPKLVRYLRREQPEVILSALGRANITAVLARRLAGGSTAVVVSERNTLSRWAQQSKELHAKLTLHVVRHVYRWADGIMAVSQGVAHDLSQATDIPRERIQVLYNPVVTPELRKKAQAPLDHPWFRPDQPPVLLAVGSLTVQKDFCTLLQAFARLRKTQAVRLMILGEGEQRSELERLVKQLGLEQDVNLPGWVDNPYPYMVRAKLFVLSSQWEGLPGVLIEALFCGTRLVATDCPSGPREILADGRYGQLVPVGDVVALAQAMEAALAGRTPSPSPESWTPFELESVVSQYINALFGRHQCAPSPSGYH